MRSRTEWPHNRPLMAVACVLLAVLLVHAAAAADPVESRGKAARAESISIGGAVEHPKSLALSALQREPATTETVSLRTGKGMLTGSYTGVLLWTLIQQATIKVSAGSKNEVMRHTIVVTSSDGYATVLSAGEIDPELGDARAILAYAKDGQPLSDRRGFARLILPADKSAGRAISGVATITVR